MPTEALNCSEQHKDRVPLCDRTLKQHNDFEELALSHLVSKR